jgi:signal transduction histidine kinase
MMGSASAVRRAATGLVCGAGAIAAVSGVIALLDQKYGAGSLISLYLLAIFPIAIRWGFWVAAVVALAAFLTFDYFFATPVHSLAIARADTAAALAVSLVSAFALGELARRARERLAEARLRAQEAALRRVATLVAEDAAPATVLSAVAEEVGRLVAADAVAIQRFDAGDEATVVANWGLLVDAFPVDSRTPLDAPSVTASVYHTQRPTRYVDDDRGDRALTAAAGTVVLRSAVGSPIFVSGRPWGAIVAGSARPEPMPADTESRITGFIELVATAISNLESQAQVQRLVDEQASLRRVATLIAGEAPSQEVFATVAEEVGRLLRADAAAVWCHEAGGEATVVGSWGELGASPPSGRRMKLDGDSVVAKVYRTGRPARFDAYEQATGDVAAYGRSVGLRSAVGTPVSVGGRLWGSIGVASTHADPMPADAESRMAEFTELLATAIANIQARTDLTASRARIVAAADEERRRVVRDLHDGAQQRLVHTIVTLKLAQRAMRERAAEAEALVDEALENAELSNQELRDLAHGIRPSALTNGGLRAAVDAVVRRLDLPVRVDVAAGRFPPEMEASAYFIVAEALTNVVKHAHAGAAAVTATVADGALRLEIRDDGVGGADASGHGLVGMTDRAAALGGRLDFESPSGGGTRVAATLPLVRR